MKYERWVNEIFWIEEFYLIIRKVSAITYDNSNKKVVLISNYDELSISGFTNPLTIGIRTVTLFLF